MIYCFKICLLILFLYYSDDLGKLTDKRNLFICLLKEFELRLVFK